MKQRLLEKNKRLGGKRQNMYINSYIFSRSHKTDKNKFKNKNLRV